MSTEFKKIKGQTVTSQGKKGMTAWHLAILKENLEAFEKLWFWAKETELNTDDLLLAHTNIGFTVLHILAMENRVGVLQKMWVCDEEY